MLESSPRLKKLLGIVLSLCLIVFIASWLYHILTQAKVTVIADDAQNYISITRIVNEHKDADGTRQAQHQITAKVNPGTYEVSAFNKPSVVTQRIVVKARQRLVVHLSLPQARAVEPVYGGTVANVATDNSQLFYTDASGELTRLGNDGGSSPLLPSTALYGLKWVSSSLGIARDTSNNLYLIKNGSASAITLPNDINHSSAITYALSPEGQIYVGQGRRLYHSSGGGYIVAYTSAKTILSLAAGPNDELAIVEGSANNNPDGAGEVTILRGGEVVRTDHEASAIAFSDDGQFLSLVDDDGYLFLDQQFHQVYSISATAGAFAWSRGKNNHSFFYSQDGSLWSFDTTSKQLLKVGVTPGQGAIDGVYPDDAGSYIYFSAKTVDLDGANDATQLYRVALGSQTYDSSLGVLSVAFPKSLDQCVTSYINLVRPTIILLPYSPASVENCQESARSRLVQYNSDPSKFNFFVGPVFAPSD